MIPTDSPPPTELLAELLLARFADLRTLVGRYNAAVDDAIGREPYRHSRDRSDHQIT